MAAIAYCIAASLIIAYIHVSVINTSCLIACVLEHMYMYAFKIDDDNNSSVYIECGHRLKLEFPHKLLHKLAAKILNTKIQIISEVQPAPL